jgi:hypothetical protein
LVSNGKTGRKPLHERQQPSVNFRASALKALHGTLRVMQNDTDPSQGPWGHPRLPHNPSQKDGDKKPAAFSSDTSTLHYAA